MNQQKICDATQSKNVIRFTYKNEDHYREFEPHIVYHSSKNQVLVGGIQTKDESQPFLLPEPHNFKIILINSLTITNKTFNFDFIRGPFTPPSNNKGIICKTKTF